MLGERLEFVSATIHNNRERKGIGNNWAQFPIGQLSSHEHADQLKNLGDTQFTVSYHERCHVISGAVAFYHGWRHFYVAIEIPDASVVGFLSEFCTRTCFFCR